MLFTKKTPLVNVLKLSGVIMPQGKKSLNLAGVKNLIDKAFNNKKVTAIAIVINSPGGSPVQSEMIANYIRYKSSTLNKPVITFVEDVAASGGYWLALSGDKIYALSSCSIVGSLGVVHASFGLEDLIKKYGIKRRVHTAGKKKVSLDIFQEEKPEDIERLNKMLNDIHSHFKNWVLKRRGKQISSLISDDDLFSGEFWLASNAQNIGLVDEVVDDMESTIKHLYGKKTKINYILPSKKIFSLPFLSKVSIDTDEIITALKAENIKSKYL